MACGTPVLLSSTTGAAELLEADHADLILESRDTQACVDRMHRLIEQEDLGGLGITLSRLVTKYSYHRQTEKLKASFADL
jgi:glycosyltransferase involved in cell wall biosynthesis